MVSNDVRVFLVVVDDTEEMAAALHYACRRARGCAGRVALLRVVEPVESQHFASIGTLMQAEAHEEAEALLERLSTEVQTLAGDLPILYVREGVPQEELLKLIDEEPRISILVLAADTGQGGPGPLVTALTGKFIGKLRIPLTIVPENLDEDRAGETPGFTP